MKKLEFSTPVGIWITCLFMVVAIVSANGDILSFVDISSVFIVVFGTLFTTIACFTAGDIFWTGKISLQSMFYGRSDAKKLVAELFKISDLVRKQGFLALQKTVESIDNPTLQRGVQLLIDNTSNDELTKIMQQSISAHLEKMDSSVNIIQKAADIAPSMGLIGTLIGLVKMLSNIDNPSTIGPAMAIALLSTLYGAFISFIILNPLASKIEYLRDDYASTGRICLKGLSFIMQKENPLVAETVLNSMISPPQKD